MNYQHLRLKWHFKKLENMGPGSLKENEMLRHGVLTLWERPQPDRGLEHVCKCPNANWLQLSDDVTCRAGMHYKRGTPALHHQLQVV